MKLPHIVHELSGQIKQFWLQRGVKTSHGFFNQYYVSSLWSRSLFRLKVQLSFFFFGPFQGVEMNFSKKVGILENYGFSLITHYRQMELYSNLVNKQILVSASIWQKFWSCDMCAFYRPDIDQIFVFFKDFCQILIFFNIIWFYLSICLVQLS